MSLQGNMSGFSLGEIFRMISFSQKTGNLVVARDGAEGRVHFRDGEIYFASTPQNSLPLGLRLVDADIISREQLDDTLASQEVEPDRRLGQILISKGLVAHDVLAGFVREQIQDALFEIFDWDDGTYCFEPASDTDEDIGLTLGVDEIVAEADKRRREWERIREVLPSPDCRLNLSTNAVAIGEKVELEPQEWATVCLVAQGATVTGLRASLHMSSLATSRMVAGMITRGVLEAAREELFAAPPLHLVDDEESREDCAADTDTVAVTAAFAEGTPGGTTGTAGETPDIAAEPAPDAQPGAMSQEAHPNPDEAATGDRHDPVEGDRHGYPDAGTREQEPQTPSTGDDGASKVATTPSKEGEVAAEIRKYIRQGPARDSSSAKRRKYPIEWLTYYGRLHRTPTRGASEEDLRRNVCEGAITDNS